MLKKVLINIGILILLVSCSSNQKLVKHSQENVYNKMSSEKAQEHFVNASVLEMKGEYAQAILEYQEALRLDPNAGIHFALSKNYLNLNKMVPALRHSKMAVEMDSMNADYNLMLGQVFYKARLIDSAEYVFEKIITKDSSNVQALFNLGSIYETDKPIQALEIYNKLLKKTGPEWNVLIKIAELNERLGNEEETVKTIEELLEFNPSSAEIKKLLIEAYIKTDKDEKALTLVEDMKTLYPDDLSLKEYEAKLAVKNENWHKAAELYKPVIESDKVNFEVKVNIGMLFVNKCMEDSSLVPQTTELFNVMDEDSTHWQVKAYLAELALHEEDDSSAIEYFKKSAELADWNSRIWIRLGGLLFDSGRIDEAIVEMDKAVKKFPDEFVINIVLGLSYAQKNKNKEALSYLKKAVNLNPTDFTSQMAYGFTLNQLGQQEAALFHLKKAYDMNPNSVQVLGSLGMIYDDLENWNKCFEYYEKALEIDSSDATILNNFAYSLSKNDIQLERALKMSKQAVDQEPENSSFLDTIGWIYFKLNDYNKAKENIEKAYEQDSSSAEVLEHLGDVYFKLDQKDKAMKFWKEALEKDRDNKKLKDKINKGEL